MSLCILNRFTVNTNGGNLIRTCYSETRRDYLIIKLVYRWNENLPLEWNKIILTSSFSFISNNIISLLSSRKEASIIISESFLCMFFEKQGYHVTNFARKTKVSNYKCWRWKHKFNVLMNLKWTKFNLNHHSNRDRLDKQ